MLGVYATLSLRYLVRRRSRTLLVVLSIALGVATLVGTQTLNANLVKAAEEAVNPFAGSLQASGGGRPAVAARQALLLTLLPHGVLFFEASRAGALLAHLPYACPLVGVIPQELDGRKRVHLDFEDASGLGQPVPDAGGGDPGKDELHDDQNRQDQHQ